MSASEFAETLKPISIEALVGTEKESISVNLQNGQQDTRFHDEVGNLKDNAVVVETQQGHGSGVVIDSEGYILTNAHVVANNRKITIKLNRKSYDATVVREEPVRDVALLKTDTPLPSHLGVRVGAHKPNAGDDIYVIGTPLSIEHAHSISRGIVSAKRKIEGLDYLQTDANVNPGNSGGPVFDQYGELIALTVSGLFTRDGANVGISYLIPINDVLAHLNISTSEKNFFKGAMAKLASSVEGVSLSHKDKMAGSESVNDAQSETEDQHWLSRLYNWLDSPLIYF